MAALLLYLTFIGLVAVIFAVVVVVSFSHAVGRGAAARFVAAALLFIVGTVPPSAFAVLWYARSADYRWAIRGPTPFGHLGGGPAMVMALTLVTLWTAGCWAAAIWLGTRDARGLNSSDRGATT